MMRVLLIFSLSVFLLSSCNSNKSENHTDGSVSPDLVTNPISASGKKEKSSLPVMEFENLSHDFGLIMLGEKVAHTFKFINKGGSDLIISNASATCGCTVPKWSREPIKPGETGTIEVVFNSAGRPGANYKTVKVLTNAQPNNIEISIAAEVYDPNKS